MTRSPGGDGTGRSAAKRLPDTDRSRSGTRTVSRRSLLGVAAAAVATAAVAPLAGCTGGLATKPGPGTPVPGAKRFDLSAVSTSLETAVKDRRADGVAMTTIQDGQVIYRRAFGTLVPGNSESLGGASGVLAATVVAALVSSGRLSFDDPVSQYIPEFHGTAAAITVAQLLAHTSGLPARHDGFNASASLADQARTVASYPLLSAPGTAFRYGPLAYQVAARVAEVAGEDNWNALVQKHINTELGTVSLAYPNNRTPSILDGASGSADDFVRVLDLQLQGGHLGTRAVLTRAVVSRMQQNATGGLPVAVPAPGNPDGYGLGMAVTPDDSAPASARYSVLGPGVYGWVDASARYCSCLIAVGKSARPDQVADTVAPLIRTALAHPLS